MSVSNESFEVDHAGDIEELEILRGHNFDGTRWNEFLDRMIRAAWPYMLKALRTGAVVDIKIGHQHPVLRAEDRQTLHDSSTEREDLVMSAIVRTIPKFQKTLRENRWRPDRGRSLSSYFIGAVADAFWVEYECWSRKRRSQIAALRALELQHLPITDVTATDPDLNYPKIAATELLLEKAAQRSNELEAICLCLLRGMTAGEIGAVLGCSARAVEGRLYKFRGQAWDLVRRGKIDPTLVPGSRANIARRIERRSTGAR